MNPIDAFLWVTVLTYFCAILLNKKFLQNVSFFTQKIFWAIIGTIWILCLTTPHPILDNPIRWLILGVIYTVSNLLCFTGVEDWGSKGHNLFMGVWDLLLAVICFSKY